MNKGETVTVIDDDGLPRDVPMETFSEWAKKAAKEYAEAEEQANKELEELERRDTQIFNDLPKYQPPVIVVEYEAGRFLEYGDEIRIPADYIEDIRAIYTGSAPSIGSRAGSVRGFSVNWVPAVKDNSDAVIQITMGSGQTHKIKVHRYHLDITLNALKDAWVGARQS